MKERGPLNAYYLSRSETKKLCAFADRGVLGNAIQHVKDTFSYAINENAKAISNNHQRDSDLSGSYQRLGDNERKFIKRPSQTLNLLGSNADTARRGKSTTVTFVMNVSVLMFLINYIP